MKLLITSRADDNIKEMTDITFDTIKAYAKKCGADFMRLDHDSGCTHQEGKWHYRILKHYDLFEEYDRILHIDSDVLVSNCAPNIFDIVPYEKIGTVYEDKGSRRPARHQCIRKVQQMYGDVGWVEGYINTGFFLSSKCHRDIFTKINGTDFYEDWGHDDVHLGYQLNKHGMEVMELPYTWNHMSMFSEPWNGSPNRFDSYVIHYAGAGIFEGTGSRLEQIKRDNSVWYS